MLLENYAVDGILVLSAILMLNSVAVGMFENQQPTMEMCSIGSGNIDFRSLENNFETNAVIYDRPMAAAVRRVFETDMESCREILREAWDRRPLLHRLFESNARIVSPLF